MKDYIEDLEIIYFCTLKQTNNNNNIFSNPLF